MSELFDYMTGETLACLPTWLARLLTWPTWHIRPYIVRHLLPAWDYEEIAA